MTSLDALHILEQSLRVAAASIAENFGSSAKRMRHVTGWAHRAQGTGFTDVWLAGEPATMRLP